MSDAIDVLLAEHRMIEIALDNLDRLAESLNQSGEPTRTKLQELVRFMREFADGKHHSKEEDMLFVMMIEGGFPRDVGPVAVMRHEHDEGRAHVSAMATVANGTGPWTETERALVYREATALTTLLRNHIQKEDNVLYPLALQRMPSQAIAELDRRVAAFESAWTGITEVPS